jgi:hypothetical protein
MLSIRSWGIGKSGCLDYVTEHNSYLNLKKISENISRLFRGSDIHISRYNYIP